MASPAMSYFLHKGICEYGYVDESFDMFRSRFDKMLVENTNQTLWEEWWLDGIGRTGKFQKGRTRSDAQTESAFAPALFAEYLLGIKPVKPGMKEVSLAKMSSGIKNVKAEIPSPEGLLKIEWKEQELVLDIPEEMKIRMDVNSLGSSDYSNVTVNGEDLSSQNSTYTLSGGSYLIKF